MHSIYKAAGSFRAALSSPFSSTERSAERLDPLVRTALAESIVNDTSDCRSACDELEEEIAQVSAALKLSVEKEQFIHGRYKHYEKELDLKAQALADEDVDEETAPDVRKRRLQLENDKTLLESVKKSHKDMIVQCEKLRRKVMELERKREKVVQLQEQCQSFVDRAASSTTEKAPTQEGEVREELQIEQEE